jgi:hypothetical protein
LLPLDVQPTTGGHDFIHTIFIYRLMRSVGLGLFLTNRFELKGINRDGYRVGDLLSTSFFVTREFGIHWGGIVQLRSERRSLDRRPTGEVPTSGSQKFFLTPQVNYSIGKSVFISGLVDVPIYQNYNLEQLGNSYAFSIAIIKKFQSGPLLEFEPGDLFK